MPKRKKSNDPLVSITVAIKTKLRRENHNHVEIGRLLLKAKSQLDHGKWLPYVETNFPLSVRTANYYMASAKFVADQKLKFATVANLEPTLLYDLAANIPSKAWSWTDDEVAAILAEAKARPISLDRAHEIVGDIRDAKAKAKAEDAAGDKFKSESKSEKFDADAILDGPPPMLPPPSTAEDQRLQCETEDVDASDFKTALAMLFRVSTRTTVGKMADAVEASTLTAVTDFLSDVVAAATRKEAAFQSGPVTSRTQDSQMK